MIWRNQSGSFRKLFRNYILYNLKIKIDQSRQSSDIDDIFEELLQSRLIIIFHTQGHHGNSYHMNILSEKILMKSFRIIINKISSRSHRCDIVFHTLRIDADHDIDSFSPAQKSSFTDSHFIPGRQTLNIGWKNIFG